MRLLIIGDLEGQIGAATRIARDRGASVTQVPDYEAALNLLREGRGADLIMIEAKGKISELVQGLKNERINVPVIACGVNSDSMTAVRAIKAGAKEYIPLPPNAELIAAVLEAITEESRAVIYQSEAMARVLQIAEQIAGSDASILITGESGTGKEVISRFIQSKSKRSGKPFISVNCAAIPENLLESELFGHEKGSFTGAVARRIGKFEEADGGTLLLDEVSEMDIRLQAKLLRALQEQEIDRVGGTKPVKINIRILATSNRDLQAEVKRGTFREDLYFRLNVISIPMPSLRDRLDDIEPLAKFFVKKYSDANGVPDRPLTKRAIDKMKTYHWPGNVRELENAMHRAVLMAIGSEIDAEAIMLSISTPTTHSNSQPSSSEVIDMPFSSTTSAPLHDEGNHGDYQTRRNDMVGRTVSSVEKDLILDTLDYCLGNRTHASNILGISIRTLRNKLKQYSDEGTPIPPAPGSENSKQAYS
jgi:two-component system response regulator FlrC